MKLSRRAVLRGAGGLVALPFLPSIARAQVARPKYFVHFATDHGGLSAANVFPVLGGGTQQAFAGRTVSAAPLRSTVQGATTVVSPLIKGPSSKLTPRLLSKLNLLQGVDVPYRIGHHTGAHLGNFYASVTAFPQITPRVTIDQLMAWSSSFYPSLATIKQRSLNMGNNLSYAWANPATRSGAVTAQAWNQDALTWFNRLFPAGAPTPGGQQRPPIVDQVMESYRELKADPRLSVDDKRRLDDHLQRLAELQRRLTSLPVVSCTRPQPIDNRTAIGGRIGLFKTEPAKHVTWYQLLNDVIVAAMACDLTRIATIALDATFSTYAGDWHQDIAHTAFSATGQQTLLDAKARFFSEVMLDLAGKLDAVSDGQGGTLLDSALVSWTQEHGQAIHLNRSTPIVTFGSAGGWFTTGQHLDYRDRTISFDGTNAPDSQRPGLLMHQWYATVLQAFGIPAAEWAEVGNGGYGPKFIDVSSSNSANLSPAVAYPDALWSASSQPLPFLKA